MPRQKRKTTAQKVQERSLTISPEQAATFPWDHRDKLLAEALLHDFRLPDIAEFTGMKERTVRDRLMDPVRCAWISQYIDAVIPSRLGQVLGAVFRRATQTGDPASAKMLLQQYNKWLGREVRENVNVDVRMDLSGLTNEELVRLILDGLRRNPQVKAEVIDVEAVITEGPSNVGPKDSSRSSE
ncbi:MAG: hypothetical protein GTO41_25090 [Burkholderiales bacterium]|nr:hypothetical protein [Burkholderiales bacterium]